MAYLSDFIESKKETNENYKKWKALKKRSIKFYFDTSDIIDILSGMKALSPFNGSRQLKKEFYRKPKQLVYAVAYKNWLGPVGLLAPHLSELYEKLNHDKFTLHYKVENLEELTNEFWSEIGVEKAFLNFLKGDFKHSQEKEKEGLDKLKENAPHIFQAAYLIDNDANWKKRYRYLNEENIIAFETEDIDYLSIGNDPVFKELQKELNRLRPLTANNYIDALALCVFDRKLRKIGPNDQAIIFYAEQKKLYDAIQKVSEVKIDGRYPFKFEYEDEYGNTQLSSAICDANFCFLVAILNTVNKDSRFNKLWDGLNAFLNALQDSKEDSIQKVLQYPKSKQALPNNVLNETPLNLVFLDFFESWWYQEGINDLKKLFVEETRTSQEYIEVEVNNYINNNFRELGNRISSTPTFFRILRETINSLTRMKQDVKRLYADEFSMNAMHEFGSRFSFKEFACEQIQNFLYQLRIAGSSDLEKQAKEFVGSSEDTEVLKTTLANYIADALGNTSDKRIEEKNQILNNLACSIGILWLLGKKTLIDKISHSFKHMPHLLDEGDEYPSPPFAIMHIAVIASKGGAKTDSISEIKRIIACVEKKHGLNTEQKNYRVWLALSYAYFRLAEKIYVKCYSIPEDLPEEERTSVARKQALEYLMKTNTYARQAYRYLKNKILNEYNEEKQEGWNRYYRYAENNIVFCESILLPAEEITTKLKVLVDDLESVSSNPDLWHESRYSDTIARYYYRLACLENNNRELMVKAHTYIKRSLNASGISEKSLQEQLLIQFTNRFGSTPVVSKKQQH